METTSWHTVFQTLIFLAAGLAGSPLIQVFKGALSAVFQKPIEDRWALLITGVVSGMMAVLEMVLSGSLNFAEISVDSFPVHFFGIFTLSTVYYAWFKGSDSLLGRKGLLR